ncbi:hypothetical protein LCGC14_2538180 [marine sediment metagenome]|uniref:Transglycosylase SLT domain-containing protein n=1 Tax=marine sediment metagenome TaxID=412755 RepID=A0A0F9AS17_9ZZZZ
MTNKEKELEQKVKIEKWLLITSIIFITLIIGIGFTIYWNWWISERKIQFMISELPQKPEKVAQSFMKWLKYYGHDDRWLEAFSLLHSESDGIIKAKSRKGCKGLMMIARKTAGYTRERLRKYMRDTSIYNIDFNLASGFLHLRNLKLHWTKDDWLLTIEVYNTGWYYYNNKKKRAPAHMKRYGINYADFSIKWKKYSSFWNLFKKEVKK